MKKCGWFLFTGLLLILAQTIYASEESAGSFNKISAITANQQPDKHRETELIEVSPEGQQAVGIKIETIYAKSLALYISAPGEAIPNKDLTTIVTPRIQAQVIDRLVKIGEHVTQGQPLVHLSSVDMAKAQADLLLTQKEWLRVKQLGKRAVSAKRYQTAEIAYQQAYSKLLAYGMTRPQIDTFLQSDDPNKANGEFTLLARDSGTIFSADFTEGQMIGAGKELYKIVNETSLWVDAKLSSGDSANIEKGAKAMVKTAHHELAAVVLQIHHKLDETTRTRVVRLSVANPKDQLHPGEFVTCYIKTGNTQPVTAVRQTTLVRAPDGDQAVYIEVKPNHFKVQEVQIIKKIGPWRVIKGLKAGTRIVTKGVFFVHAESLKGSFSSHNH